MSCLPVSDCTARLGEVLARNPGGGPVTFSSACTQCWTSDPICRPPVGSHSAGRVWVPRSVKDSDVVRQVVVDEESSCGKQAAAMPFSQSPGSLGMFPAFAAVDARSYQRRRSCHEEDADGCQLRLAVHGRIASRTASCACVTGRSVRPRKVMRVRCAAGLITDVGVLAHLADQVENSLVVKVRAMLSLRSNGCQSHRGTPGSTRFLVDIDKGHVHQKPIERRRRPGGGPRRAAFGSSAGSGLPQGPRRRSPACADSDTSIPKVALSGSDLFGPRKSPHGTL